jgi:hypothetical protein
MKPETLNIGGGHTLQPIPDRDGKLIGYIHTHPAPNSGMYCQYFLAVKKMETVAVDVYEIVQPEPLTLAPTVKCLRCGLCGYVRSGQWVPITLG